MRKLWRTYRYIYYWLYTWQKKVWGESNAPEFNASIGLSMSMGCNILSIIVLIDVIFGVKTFPHGIPMREGLIGIVIVLLFHYIIFIYKNKYEKIEKEFEKESKEIRKRKGKWVLFYAFGSLAFYVFLLFFGIWLQNEF